MSRDATKLIMGGFVATLIHTLLIYSASLSGLANVDVAGALGLGISPNSYPLYPSTVWMAGLGIHLFLGSFVFPLLYGATLGGKIHASPALCGLAWGMILFCVGQFMIMPLLGMTDYFLKYPSAILVFAIAHAAYGLVFGSLAGVSMYARLLKDQSSRYGVYDRPDLAVAR